MERSDALYRQYLNILEEELRPAMGCTEPIALAYAGAKAKVLLGTLPDKICVWVSGNIIKNVKSVVVPNTGGLHGIAAAVCAGVVVGEAEKQLEVISCVSEEGRAALASYMETAKVEIHPAESELIFDIDLHLYAGEDHVRVRIVNHHTNLVHISKNGEVLLDLPVEDVSQALDAVCAPVSLYDPVYADGGDPLTVMEQVRDTKNTESNWMEHIALRDAFGRLGEREKQILSLRFYDGKTQMEVASVLGISQAQVSRLEKGAIAAMRKSVAVS